jgi:hypothetical protein
VKGVPLVKRWVLGGGLFLVILLVVIWFLSKGFLSSAIEKRLLGELEKATGQEAVIQKIDFSLFPPSLTLGELDISGSGSINRRDLFTVKKAHLRFSPWSYFTKLLVIDRLELSEPHLYCSKEEGGRSQIEDILENLFSTESSSPEVKIPKFNIKKLLIHRGRINCQIEKFSINLSGIDVSLQSGFLMRRFNGRIQTTNGSFLWKEKTVPFDRMEGRFLVTSSHLTISHFKIEQEKTQITLQGTVNNFQDPQMEIQIESQVDLEKVSPFLPLALPVSGVLEFNTGFKGYLKDAKGKGHFTLDPLFLDEHPVDPLSIQFAYQVSERTLSITGIEGQGMGGNLTGHWVFPWDQGLSGMELDFNLTQIDPLPILAYFYPEIRSFGKAVGVNLSIQGKGLDLFSYQGEGTLTARSPSTVPFPIPSPTQKKSEWVKDLILLSGQVEIAFQFSNQTLWISSGRFSSPHSQLVFSGTIDRKLEMALAYQTQPADLGELLPLFGVHGLDGKGKLSGLLVGNPSNPRSHAHLELQDITYRGNPVGFLTSRLLFKEGVLEIYPTVLRAGNSRYEVGGIMRISPDDDFSFSGLSNPFFDLSLKIDQGVPRDVVSLFYKELPVMGVADGDLKFLGTPRDFELRGSFDVGAGSAYGQAFDSGLVSLIVKRDGITFEQVEVWRNESLLTGKGTLSFDKSFSVEISTESLELEEIDFIYDRLPYFEGKIAGVIQGHGPFNDPRFSLAAGVTRIAYQEKDLGQGRIQGVIEGKEFKIDSEFFDHTLHLNAQLGLESLFPFQIDLSLIQARIDPVLGLFMPKLFSSLPIRSSGRISGGGNLKALDGASFQIALSDLSLQLGDHLVKNDGDIHFKFQTGVFEIGELKLKSEETILSIDGSLKPFYFYNLFVRGETDLSVLSLFTREIKQAKGKAYLAIRIFNEWNDPKIRGGLSSSGGTIRSETLSQTVNLKSLGLLFNERQVLLESFEGEVGGGTLSGSGKLKLHNFSFVDFGLLLELNDVRFKVPDGLSSIVNGTLFFQGNPETRDLKGEILIQRATYSKKVEWKTWVTEVVTGKIQKEQSTIPLIGNTRLNLHVLGKNNIRVDNNLSKFPLTVDLFIRGTLNQPLVLGRMETGGGTFFFRRNTFDIKSGAIDFINPEKTNPIFDVQAETKIRDYKIDLNLTGSLDSFNIVFTSNPSLSDTDILSLLLTGKTAEEVAEAQGGIGTTELVSIATGGVQEEVEHQFEEITGFDRIQVDPYYSGSKAAGGVLITVSEKLLDDDLTVTYSVTPMDVSEQQTVLIEYLLHRNIYLVGRRDELGNVSGNIRFRFEYR